MHLKLNKVFTVRCYEYVGGPLLWEDSNHNLIPTEGLNGALTDIYKASAYTATWFVGLVDNAMFTMFAATDTAAQINGTNQWKEATYYSETVRQTLTLGSVSAGAANNSASLATFTINGGGGTLNGAFIATSSTKTGTAGLIGGEATFNDGTHAVVAGNVITVQVDVSAA